VRQEVKVAELQVIGKGDDILSPSETWHLFIFLLFLKHVPKVGKGIVGHGLSLVFNNPIGSILIEISPVLIVMAIDTEILPIAPVRRIVFMVVVFVVDGEQVEVLERELSAAAGTYPWMDSQGLLTVAFHSLCIGLSGFRNDLIHLFLA
jgi:hypothetical protein